MGEVVLKGNLGNYSFDPSSDLVHHGKFSRIFFGKTIETQGKVAIKTVPLKSEISQIQQSFQYESAFKFTHPGLLKIIELIYHEKVPYLISEWIEGESLKALLKRKGRLSWEKGVELGIKILESVKELHAHSVLHHDIKPSNLIITSNEKEKSHVSIVDFGLAIKRDNNFGDFFPVTKPFSMIYAAPEQLLNAHHILSEATDLFSVAIILFECITGNFPYYDEHPLMILNLQLTYPLPTHARIPNKLHSILAKAVTKPHFKLPPQYYNQQEIDIYLKESIADRFQSADEFIAALNDVLVKKEMKWYFLK